MENKVIYLQDRFPERFERDPIQVSADEITRYAMISFEGYAPLKGQYRMTRELMGAQIEFYDRIKQDLPDHLKAWKLHIDQYQPPSEGTVYDRE